MRSYELTKDYEFVENYTTVSEMWALRVAIPQGGKYPWPIMNNRDIEVIKVEFEVKSCKLERRYWMMKFTQRKQMLEKFGTNDRKDLPRP